MAATGPVRWGILSLANITRRFLPALRAASNAELVAVASRRPGAAEPLIAAQPGLRVHGDHEALLDDRRSRRSICPCRIRARRMGDQGAQPGQACPV
jgi:hypothetical protein